MMNALPGDGWSNPYVGLAWQRFGRGRDGVDCWGLAVLVYREILGIALADHLEVPIEGGMAEAVDAIAAADPWRRVETPRAFDVAVFRMGALRRHVGIVAGGGRMLHVADGELSSLAPLDGVRWRHRLLGYCRHAALMEAAR
ncbi:NlpC/P60 family protein [Ancylobacter lacus]|uniref:NlpC/P60 family protein n=1 Tax=Ancylobacter lacus TaxID=2579970 RepID=UPI001BCA78AB|nr:NlpC/P60 family protein [Ancylobacter lacus]MBS7538353.1 C40 family peptidase [Ancylobacter lacus]